MIPKSRRIRFSRSSAGVERVQHQRRERGAIDLVEQRSTQHRLARADVSRDDDEPLAAADRILQQIERVAMRLAPVQEPGIRGQAEWFLGESDNTLRTWSVRVRMEDRRRQENHNLDPIIRDGRMSEPKSVAAHCTGTCLPRRSRTRLKPATTMVSPSASLASMSASPNDRPANLPPASFELQGQHRAEVEHHAAVGADLWRHRHRQAISQPRIGHAVLFGSGPEVSDAARKDRRLVVEECGGACQRQSW